jgi:signal transduction histidine kinase
MFKNWRLTDRTRTLLTLELAMVLPAAALMGFSIWHLKHIQRNQFVQAAMQRDFDEALRYAQHKSWKMAYHEVLPIRTEFPSPEDGPNIKNKLDHILTTHPEFAYAAIYDKGSDMLVSRMQPGRDPMISGYTQDELNMVAKWAPFEAGHMVSELHRVEQQEDEWVMFTGDWEETQHAYWNIAYFVPPGVAKDRVVLGLVAFDPDYLRKTFLPAVMKDVLTSKNGVNAEANPPAIMIRPTKTMDETPWITSGNWDGKAEWERPFPPWILEGLTMGIKYQGITVAELGNRFFRYNYTTLGALSILMIGGIWLTYRNVNREMKLARLKSDFVANVSHELRTPLALIRLYAETLELGRLTAKQKYQEYFRIIREESERLTALINNILDFSRIEAGRKEYEFKETNLSELVCSTLDSYRFQIEQHGFALEENIAHDIPPVNVDREAIARSLLNLVNNALKYSKDNKYIGVSLYRANGSVKLEVQDHGIGIPADEHEKIFEKFYRCGDPLVHNIKGSGLGLSLVRHIARAHGGDVQVDSAPDKGSKFTIELPLKTVPHTENGIAVA